MTTHFFTAGEVEVPAVTAAQMREIDRIAVEETGPNLFQMMENAGRNLAVLVTELLGANWQGAEILVLAGGGGSGGGGICAARHLANHGARVRHLPSGLDATTGDSPGVVIHPEWTMTLALPKTGLRPERTGVLFLADIGIPEGTYRRAGLAYRSPFAACFTIALHCRDQPD